MTERSASHRRWRRRFIYCSRSYPGGLGTLASIHPPRWARPRRRRANNDFVRPYPGGLGTLALIHPPRCDRNGEGMLRCRRGLDCTTTLGTRSITPLARRVCVPPCSDTVSWLSMSLSSWPLKRQWGGPCVSLLFLSLDPRPAPPRATTVLGPPLAPRLARHWPQWDRPNDTDPLEVLVHPAPAGVVDSTFSDCLPT